MVGADRWTVGATMRQKSATDQFRSLPQPLAGHGDLAHSLEPIEPQPPAPKIGAGRTGRKEYRP